MFDALYTNGLFSVKIQRFIDAIAPQKENSNGWYIYYIGGRFYQLPWNTNWNDDWRWRVTYCT